MIAPMSFPVWLLLVAMIGMPIHVLLRHRHAQTRFNYAAFAALTISLAMAIGFAVPLAGPGADRGLHVVMTDLVLSLCMGTVFGVPLGLVFRGVVVKKR